MPPKKLQRWIDLLAALLSRRFPATFRELARDVPAYMASKSEDARMRMFERDKDELRAFGIPIATTTRDADDGETGAYAIDRKSFYLPYLILTSTGGRAPRKLDRFGYKDLGTLAFEPDELEAVAQAARRVQSLGDPLLAADSASAQRKLAIDVPVIDEAGGASDVVIAAQGRVEPAVFEALNDALARRKTISFEYHAMTTDRTERRTVEPYGIFFLGAHWYLAGRDLSRGALRNFRLSRIATPKVNHLRSQTPDFNIPPEFRIREHAQSRQAWEVGDGDALDAIVEFRGTDGAVAAGARLGRAVEGHPDRRAFQPRRLDVFARWLLAFGGDAVPLAPPALVDAYRDLARRTHDLYAATPGGE